ncbi:MAG: preprotein translocase subunit YajC [Acidobacteria bacterium]|nr:MAG: preprotein translocase subunit YajC [Acidobacteriota bacterium]
MFSPWFVTWQAPSSFFGNQFVLILIIFGLFYLIMIRPMRKSQKETETMRDELKNGDRVLTTGGIYGTVVGVHDDRIQLKVADSVKVQVAKSAVTQLDEEPSKRS